MKRLVLVLLALLLVVAVVPVSADVDVEYTENVAKDSHKVRNKWDLSGSFLPYSEDYDWGLSADLTWTYEIHIKEAMDGEYSVGSIHFMTEGVDVVGHVEATKTNYPYWSPGTYPLGFPNLAAVGTAEYNDQTYYFMFLYAERAVWFVLSTTSYQAYWDAGDVYGRNDGTRLYQIHSPVYTAPGLPLDYKEIHE